MTLKVTDHWLLAVLAIIVGALIPLWLQLYLQRRRPLKAWSERLRDFEGEYAAAEEKWQKHREPPDSSRLDNARHPLPDLRKPSETSLTKHVTNIENAIDNYLDGNLFLDKGADAYKAIDASIALTADDIGCYGNEDGLAAQLRALWTALDELVDFLNTKFPTSRRPRFSSRSLTRSRSPRGKPNATASLPNCLTTWK